MARQLKTLPFAIFIRRQKIFCVYRNMMRIVRKLDDVSLRKSIVSQIQLSFRGNRHLSDSAAIKSCLTEANRSLEQLQAMVDQPKEEETSKYSVGTDWPWMR